MPSPAGASAAAVTAAIAASVVVMAGEGSSDWDEGHVVAARARAAREQLVELADEDVVVFEAVLRAGREPGRAELPAALDRATLVPLQIGERALEVATLAARAVECAKRAVRPDAAAAAALAKSASRVALTVVEVNLGHPAFPVERVGDIRARVGAVRSALESLS